MAKRSQLTETNDPRRKVVETDYEIGFWLQDAGSGTVEPLEPGNPVQGLCLEKISAMDSNYDSNDRIAVDVQWNTEDRAEMAVGTGTATVSMEGQSFDVDAADAGALDVSAPGTQFKITKFINADLVEVQVMLFKEDLLA